MLFDYFRIKIQTVIKEIRLIIVSILFFHLASGQTTPKSTIIPFGDCSMFLADTAFGVSNARDVDSLIKLNHDILVIGVVQGGDLNFFSRYWVLYYENNGWTYVDSNKHILSGLNDVPRDFLQMTPGKSCFVNCTSQVSSGHEEYFYIYVVKKVIRSICVTNRPIADLMSANADLKKDLVFFDEIDKYLVKKARRANGLSPD